MKVVPEVTLDWFEQIPVGVNFLSCVFLAGVLRTVRTSPTSVLSPHIPVSKTHGENNADLETLTSGQLRLHIT